MSSAESGSEILAARERRQEILDRHLVDATSTLLFLSLNIPGEEKSPPGSGELFTWMQGLLTATFPDLALLEQGNDRLGPWALYGVTSRAQEAKLRCISLEGGHPAARLVDLDIYDRSGVQIGRDSLGLPPRPCLLCRHPAVECIRQGRHGHQELAAAARKLLADFGTPR